ncbi:hypothetical protein VPNG_04149 [Cytospora leucostoma]|uniref:Uncharacterized protein n=1 Tax=Cytospora leucostoma TaxID=1230097 RepID=A0A423XDK0_9PEZI|nr:hypothetical protein VPNG_04149 [Cytospora leucostoma]
MSGLRADDRPEAEAVQQPVEAQCAQQAVDDAAEAEAAEQAAHDAQDAAEEQADGGDDLEEGLAQEAPQGVELLLGVGEVLELALGAVDGLRDGACELCVWIDVEVELLGCGLTRASLVLSVGLDVAVGVETADDAVRLAEDVAALLDQRADLLDQGLLVALVLGLALRRLDLGRDQLADGLDLVEALLQAHGHLDGELLVLLPLQPLLLLLLRLALGLGLLRDVRQEVDVAHRHALGVDHVAVVVDLLAGADERVSRRQLADQVALIVDDVTLLVDGEAGHRSLLLLDLLGRPALSLAEHIAVLVDNVTILINGTTSKDLGVSRDEAADNLAGWRHDLTVLVDGQALEVGEDALLGPLTLALGHKLRVAEDIAGLAEDLAVLVAHAADHALEVAVNDTAVDDTIAIDNVTCLVDTLAGKYGPVNLGLGLRLGLLLFLPAFGPADDVPGLVEDLAVRVDALALEELEVALDDLADLLAVPEDVALGVDGVALEGLEGLGLQEVLELVVGDGLRPADLLSAVVPNDAVLVDLAADQVLRDALDDAADGLALVVDDVAELVDGAALQDGVVDLGRVGGSLVRVAGGGLEVFGLVNALGQRGAGLRSLALGLAGLGGSLVGVACSSLKVLRLLGALGQCGTGLGTLTLGSFALSATGLSSVIVGVASSSLQVIGLLDTLGKFGAGLGGALSLGARVASVLELFRRLLREAHLGLRALALSRACTPGLALGLLLLGGTLLARPFSCLLAFGSFTWRMTVISGVGERILGTQFLTIFQALYMGAPLARGGGLQILGPLDTLG